MNKIEFGDCRVIMKRWLDESIKVQMCVTSPPYFGLRDYAQAGQIGLEQRAPEYVAVLVDVFQLVRDLLTDDGVLFVNIGDTYAGFKDGKFPPQSQANGNQRGMPTSGAPHRSKRLLELDGFKNKELMGIPWRFALAMHDAGWYLRQDKYGQNPITHRKKYATALYVAMNIFSCLRNETNTTLTAMQCAYLELLAMTNCGRMFGQFRLVITKAPILLHSHRH